MINNDVTKNVFGQPLVACSFDPLTGFFRDGCCKTNRKDVGSHLLCAIMTDEFLRYSLAQGNDLITPNSEWQFAGLKAGDQWCVCVDRWVEAYEAGVAPKLRLESSHAKALETISLEVLRAHEARLDE
jgi:uncharacterized protein